MDRYVLMDHTADLMVKAFGETLEECFANAGYALFNETVDLSGIGTSERTEFEVSGIDEEDSKRLFETFTKVNDLSDGLGLGLPLTMRHITNLGGDITIDANYHDGCRLIVQLPKRSV